MDGNGTINSLNALERSGGGLSQVIEMVMDGNGNII